MKKHLIIIAILIFVQKASYGDYWIPDFKQGIKGITQIADVFVTGFNDSGHAQIKTNKIIYGQEKAISLIKDIHLTCKGGSPKKYGLKENTRYIVFLNRDNLYEEQSFFIVKEEQGVVKFKVGPSYRNWFGKNVEWITTEELLKKINEIKKTEG